MLDVLVPNFAGRHPYLRYDDIRGSFLGIRRWGLKFITHLCLFHRLRMGIIQLSASREA